MKKYARYWILSGFIVTFIICIVVSGIQITRLSENTFSLYSTQDFEENLPKGTYYVYKKDSTKTDGYLTNDYGSSFSLVHTVVSTTQYRLFEFDASLNQEKIKMSSILNNYWTTNALGFAFATFEVEESGTVTIDPEVTVVGIETDYSVTFSKFVITQTHPRELVIWESVQTVSEILLVLSILAIPVLVYSSMRQKDYLNHKK